MNRFAVRVVTCAEDGSSATLASGDVTWTARPWPGLVAGAEVAVRIRPEDVVLCLDMPGAISTRNVLPGTVRGVRRGPGDVLVTVDVGLPLVARVTPATVRDLGLGAGRSVVALVKATAVRPDVTVHAPLRASVVGPSGDLLEPRRLDLLRAIARTGSITAAARDQGITYRAAWLWIDGLASAWGEPLVAAVQGGTGGGGATLTLAGHGILELADRAEAVWRGELPDGG